MHLEIIFSNSVYILCICVCLSEVTGLERTQDGNHNGKVYQK